MKIFIIYRILLLDRLDFKGWAGYSCLDFAVTKKYVYALGVIMPRYEYKCKKCESVFEVVHGINESLDKCSTCGGELRRVFHPVGIVFKGSGFYSTDHNRHTNATARETFTSSSGPNGKDSKASDNGDSKGKIGDKDKHN